MDIRLEPACPKGTLTAPPSKSMAHRLLVCAALSGGRSRVGNVDESVDICATKGAMAGLGAVFVRTAREESVQGAGAGFVPPRGPVQCEESGSTLRFLIPVFALLDAPVTFAGAPRLFQRPLKVYRDLFAGQGLAFKQAQNSLQIKGPLQPGTFRIQGDVSSQFISGLLFALPLLQQDSVLRITPPFESASYVKLTQKAQSLFGVQSYFKDEFTLHIPGGQQYSPASCTVEGDWSQGAVPAVLAALGCPVQTAGLDAQSAQGDRAILEILRRCGADIQWQGGVLRITPPQGGLHSPGDIDLADCPDLGPVLCTLLAFCPGATRIVNAGRLRIKESDRIASMEQVLGAMGAQITSDENSVTVVGAGPLRGDAVVDGCNDHRIVMAAAAAAWAAGVPVVIRGAQAVRKSWPGFFKDFAALGAVCKQL